MRESRMTDPRKLEWRNELSHMRVYSKWQFRNAEPLCCEPVRSAPVKSQSVNVTDSVTRPERSVSRNRQPT